LKLGVLLCSQELLFQFAFQCDWFIFARIMPLEQQNFRFFQFSGLFFAIFAAIGLKLRLCFVIKSYCSSSCFGVNDSFA
jgi:hypothetical protein